ncbi:MAG: hypothetical protein E7164_03505 [Firmicutes bacterium]|nr:hypothetical protein [Bacillota bacterium]
MKDFLNKMQDLIKKNYIASVIIAVIILVVIASFVIIGVINLHKNYIELANDEKLLYQYFDLNKKEFAAKLSYENDKLVNISSKEYNVYENSPIYYKEQTGIIIPKESSIVFYYRQNLSYTLPKYSSVLLEDSASVVHANGKENPETNFFIYDGVDLYIMPTASLLKVNGNEIKLSKYSYIIANNNYVTYYDYENDTVKKIENISKATLTVNDMVIDLLKDVTVLNSEVILLNSKLSTLSGYLED